MTRTLHLNVSTHARTVIALIVAILWGAGYIVAIIEHDASIAAAATPVVLCVLGYLLGENKAGADG